MLTLDANVWIAAFDPRDRFHEQSTAFLYFVSQRRLQLYGPAFLVVEAASALARRAQNSSAGEAARQRLHDYPLLVMQPLSNELLTTATHLGVQRLLRGGDALYAATAAILDTPLISWDAELIRRAGALTPADWLAAQS